MLIVPNVEMVVFVTPVILIISFLFKIMLGFRQEHLISDMSACESTRKVHDLFVSIQLNLIKSA